MTNLSLLALTANGKAKPEMAAMNHPTYRFEVVSKAGFADPAGAALLAQLPLIGVHSVSDIRVGTLYEIKGRLSVTQATTVANQLLTDPITQDSFINNGKTLASQIGPHWRIEVWLKPSVADPIAESVQKAVVDLGFPKPESVRSGIVYKLLGRMNQSLADKIALKLLVNPVVHRFTVESC